MTQIPYIENLPQVPFSNRFTMPAEPGIYFALRGNGEVLYIGQSGNLATRWNGHHRTRDLERLECDRIAWLTVSDASMLPEIEHALIAHFTPELNWARVERQPHDLSAVRKGSFQWLLLFLENKLMQLPVTKRRQLAEHMGTTLGYVNHLVSGRSRLTLKQAHKVVDFFGGEILITMRQMTPEEIEQRDREYAARGIEPYASELTVKPKAPDGES